MKKYVVTIVLLVILLGAALAYIFVIDLNGEETPVAEFVEAKKGDLAIEIISYGELTSFTTNPVYIPESLFTDFEFNEIQLRYLVPEGKVVEKGEVIIRIDESVYDAYKSRIEKEIAGIRSDIENIQADSTRQLKDVKLALENAIIDLEIRRISAEQSQFDPSATHERMKLEFRKSQLSYENALTNYNNARNNLLEKYAAYPERLEELTEKETLMLPALRRLLTIQSPTRGVVSYINVPGRWKGGEGSVVKANEREVLAINDLNSAISRCFIEEDLYSRVHVGQNIKVGLMAGGGEIDATISFIKNQIETVQGKRGFAIEAVINNADFDLIPNQTTVNRITLATFEDVVYVPYSSILMEGDVSYVVTEEGRLQVESEKGNENYAVIRNGLTPGQMIYLNASRAEVY
jgi:HlyD family secretion protein